MAGRGGRRFVWPIVWAVVAVVLVGRAAGRPSTRGVILDHLEFGRRLLAGEDVYGPWKSDPDAPLRPLHAPYPPSFGLLTAPFAALDAALGHRAARLGWALLQLCALAALAFELRRLTAPRAPPERAAAWQWLWLGAFLLAARFVLRDTHGGGGNLINVALCLSAFGAAERGRPWLAGILLGFSLATKPTQVWLLPVLWLMGHRRAVLATGVAGALAVAASLALLRFEVGPWLRWFQGSWLLATQADPFATPVLGFPPFEWMNQGLRFAVARWCGAVPPELADRVALGVPPGLGWSTAAVAALVRVGHLLVLGALLLGAFLARRAAAARLWVFAGALVASLLLSPLTWKAHHVALVPLLVLLLQAAVWRRSRAAAVMLGLFALCCALPGRDLIGAFGGEAFGDDADEWLNSVYVVTFFDLLLLGVALAVAYRTRFEQQPAAATPVVVRSGFGTQPSAAREDDDAAGLAE